MLMQCLIHIRNISTLPHSSLKTDNFKIHTIQIEYAEMYILQMPRIIIKLILYYKNHTLEC